MIFAADFETTTLDTFEDHTEVWSSAICPVFENKIADESDVHIFNSLDKTFAWLCRLCRISEDKMHVLYYHNLAFDGVFWLNFLFEHGYKAGLADKENETFRPFFKLERKEFSCTINDRGIFYSISFRLLGKIIQLRDSYKLLPYSLDRIGGVFSSRKKLEMKYSGNRHSGGIIPEEDKPYICNDVLILSDALNYMFSRGYDKLTIGSNCLETYKNMFRAGTAAKESMLENLDQIFPNLEDTPVPGLSCDADEFCRAGYYGGWCYAKPDRCGHIIENGQTLDVNSLYPSVMHSRSGNKYPFGKPWFRLHEAPQFDDRFFYYVRVRCRFRLKEGFLPFIQIKGSPFYDGTEMLETSDVWNKETEKYDRFYVDRDGLIKEARPVLTFAKPYFELFQEHYEIYDIEYIGTMYFQQQAGLFDGYINRYYEDKKTAKGARREEDKLFLNNLYGKLSTNRNSSFKIPYLHESGKVCYTTHFEENKKTFYIPAGAAVTAYARCFTIRAAQANYDRFCYSDTDSIHLIGQESAKGVTVSDTELLCWKQELLWEKAIFVRQKTYMEYDGKEWEIKCAGMGKRTKALFQAYLSGNMKVFKEKYPELYEKMEKVCPEELKRHCKPDDFRVGLRLYGNLKRKNIPGGVVLYDDYFQIRP